MGRTLIRELLTGIVRENLKLDDDVFGCDHYFIAGDTSAGFRELPSARRVPETREAPAMPRPRARPCLFASSASPVAAERGGPHVELLATTSVRSQRPLPTRPGSASRCTSPPARSAG